MFSGLSAGINQGLRMQDNQILAQQKFDKLKQEEIDKKKQKQEKANKQWQQNMEEQKGSNASKRPPKKKLTAKAIRQEISKLGSFDDPDLEARQFEKKPTIDTKLRLVRWLSPKHQQENGDGQAQFQDSSQQNGPCSKPNYKTKQLSKFHKEQHDSHQKLKDENFENSSFGYANQDSPSVQDLKIKHEEKLTKSELQKRRKSLFHKNETSGDEENEDYEDSQENQMIQMAFKFGKKKYDKRTLYIFSQRNIFRRIIVRILEHKAFEYFILILILMNSIALAIYDYGDRDANGYYNQVIEKIGDTLTYLFAIECAMKIIGYGFIVSKFSYLRDGWNIIDFFVVITGLMEVGGGSIKLKSLRVLRVLRPLRSINAVPSNFTFSSDLILGMKKLVGALIQSLPDFFNVAIFLAFIFVLFAILGVHQYNGVLYNRCRYNPQPEAPNFWKQVDSIPDVCTQSDSGNFACPSGYYCGNPADYDIDLAYENITNNIQINYGITTFDNVAVSLLTVFQIITTDGWTPIMLNLENAEIPFMAAFFSIVLIIVASFFLMNLILAVIIQAFIRIQKIEIELEILKYEDEQDQQAKKELERIEAEKLEKENKRQQRSQPQPQESEKSVMMVTDKASDKASEKPSSRFLNVPSLLQNLFQSPKRAGDNTRKEEQGNIKSEKISEIDLSQYKKAITQDAHKSPPPPMKRESDISINSALTAIEEVKVRDQNDNQTIQPKYQEYQMQKKLNPILEQKFQIIKNRQRSRSILTTKLLIQGLSEASKNQEAAAESNQQATSVPPPGTPVVKQLTSLTQKRQENLQLEERTADFSFLKNRNIQRGVINQITQFKQDNAHQKQLSQSVIHQNLNILFKQLTNLASENSHLTPNEVIQENEAEEDEQSEHTIQSQFQMNDDQTPKSQTQQSKKLKPKLKPINENSKSLQASNVSKDEGGGQSSDGIQYTEQEVDRMMAQRKEIKKQLGNEEGAKQQSGQIFQRLIQMRKAQKIEEENKGTSKNMIADAMNNLFNKKQEEFRTQEQYISQVLKDAKQEYHDKENSNKQTNLRTLVQQKLSLKLSKMGKEEQLSKLEMSIQKRAKDNKLFWAFYRLQKNKHFNTFISLMIIGNTIDLSLDRYPLDQIQSVHQDAVNSLFSFLFVAEMIVKLLGSGMKYYLKDAFNIFDCVVVLSSMIDFTLQQALNSESNGAITAFRAFRLLRVFKLAKSWKKLQNLLTTMVSTLKDISTFSILLFLFMFIYALLALELFANRVKFAPDGSVDLSKGISTNTNFDNLINSFTTVFIVLTNDGWSNIFYDCHRSTGSAQSIIYFISLIVIGQKILLNLFLAILLENFDEESLNQDIKDKLNDYLTGEKKKLTIYEQIKEWVYNKIYKRCYEACCKKNKNKLKYDLSKSMANEKNMLTFTIGGNGQLSANNDDLNSSKHFLIKDDKSQDSPIKRRKANKFLNVKENQIVGISLGIFKQTNPIRILVHKLVMSSWFEFLIIIVIVISGVQLALERPLNDPNSKLQQSLMTIDIVTTIIFCMECVFKTVAFGFLRNGKNSYLRSPWNAIDFIIIIFSIISLTPLSNTFKTFKMLRVVRAIRLIGKNEGLKVAIKALIQAIPQIINVSIITMLIFLIFGIIAVNFFKGRFYFCDLTSVDPFLSKFVNHKWDCLSSGGEWVNQPWSFDNIFQAMKAMFQMATTSGWSDIMYAGTKCTSIDYVPQVENNIYWVFFFIFFIIVGSFFMLNLFVGVVISIFNREKDNIRGNNLLTDSQKQWIDTMLITLKAKPIKFHKIPDNRFRRFFFKLSKNEQFDRVIFACILLNTLILLIKYYNQPYKVSFSTDILNYVFTAIFAGEAIVKLIAIDKQYFDDSWNIFDFIVVAGSLFSMAFSSFTSIRLGGATTIIRAFRITRVFRLVKKAKTLKTVFNSFIYTIPALANVGGLLLLLLYLYSIVGVIMFGDVMRNGLLDDTLNYENFPNAFVTLFVISTGDAWDQIMAASIRSNSIQFQCIDNPSYQDYVDNGFKPIGCGSGEIGYLFYYSYILLVNLIFLNLFIAIILQGYEDTQQKESKLFNQDKLDNFRRTWARYDPNATTFIKIAELKEFLFELGKPLGWDEKMKEKAYQQERFIAYLDLPIYNNFSDYMFMDVLEALALRVVVLDQLHKENENIIKKQQENFEILGTEQYDINDYRKAQKEMKQKIEQDINKMKFKEDVSNIHVVKEVQQIEQKRKTNFQLQPDKNQGQVFTSLHQAAAIETVKHMKFIIKKKKMIKAQAEQLAEDDEDKTKATPTPSANQVNYSQKAENQPNNYLQEEQKQEALGLRLRSANSITPSHSSQSQSSMSSSSSSSSSNHSQPPSPTFKLPYQESPQFRVQVNQNDISSVSLSQELDSREIQSKNSKASLLKSAILQNSEDQQRDEDLDNNQILEITASKQPRLNNLVSATPLKFSNQILNELAKSNNNNQLSSKSGESNSHRLNTERVNELINEELDDLKNKDEFLKDIIYEEDSFIQDSNRSKLGIIQNSMPEQNLDQNDKLSINLIPAETVSSNSNSNQNNRATNLLQAQQQSSASENQVPNTLAIVKPKSRKKLRASIGGTGEYIESQDSFSVQEQRNFIISNNLIENSQDPLRNSSLGNQQ